MLNVNELRNELPKIGDILIKTPVTNSPIDKKPRKLHIDKKPKKAYPCVVTYVHPEYLWYQVEFNINGCKFKQNYNLVDDDYNEEMHKYWNKDTPGCDDQYKQRRKHLYNANKKYNGKSATPKRLSIDPLYKNVFDITRELENYNKKHKTNLSYGKYLNMICK